VNRETSLYLDIIRLSAAMVVFLGHISGQPMTGALLWQIGPYMSQAVTVFFVLSGFVIGYVTEDREATPVAYATSRLARIYSVALPALVLTFLLDALGRSIDGSAYSEGFQTSGQAWQFFSGLLFVHQNWFLNVQQGSNFSYWSLGYEVWYYLIFGLFLFARWRIFWAGLAMLAAGPAILAMFPLWLLGVGAYHASKRTQIGNAAGMVLFLGTAGLWLIYELWAMRHGRALVLTPSFLRRPELAQDYLVSVLFAVHLVGFSAASPLFAGALSPIASAVRWAAGATFTLYLLHEPVARLLLAISPWSPASWPNRILILGGTLTAVAAVAEMTERRKVVWRRGFERLFGGARVAL
jgi:peptidoglycan/LPS O-acetylase OafA/YrhL